MHGAKNGTGSALARVILDTGVKFPYYYKKKMSMVDAETDEDPDPLPLTTTCNHAKHAAVNVTASGRV